MCEVLALSFICLSQNETESEQALVAIERQRVIMPERGRIRKKPSVRQPPHAVLFTSFQMYLTHPPLTVMFTHPPLTVMLSCSL